MKIVAPVIVAPSDRYINAEIVRLTDRKTSPVLACFDVDFIYFSLSYSKKRISLIHLR